MAISKKGLRKVVLDEKIYYWKFHEKITVISEDNPKSVLVIDFGYFDIWLYINKKERPPDFEPQIVTPKFVSESIKFALKNNWIDSRIVVKFNNGEYKIISRKEN